MITPSIVSIRKFNFLMIFINSIHCAVHSQFLCDEMSKNLINLIKISYICMRFFQMYEIFWCFSPHEFTVNSAMNRIGKNHQILGFPNGYNDGSYHPDGLSAVGMLFSKKSHTSPKNLIHCMRFFSGVWDFLDYLFESTGLCYEWKHKIE